MLIPEFDVFLSYAPEDRERIQPLVKALEQGGFQVWWEHHYLKAEQSIALLERQLNANRVQMVVWSKDSAGSGRVQAEARIGSHRGRLLATRLEKIIPPRETVAAAYADLSTWSGEENHPGLQQAFTAIKRMIGQGEEAKSSAASPEQAPAPQTPPSQPVPSLQPQITQAPPPMVETPPIPAPTNREEMAWQGAVKSKLVRRYEAYLKEFPEGKYKAEAEAFLEKEQQANRKIFKIIGGILGGILLIYIIIVLTSMF